VDFSRGMAAAPEASFRLLSSPFRGGMDQSWNTPGVHKLGLRDPLGKGGDSRLACWPISRWGIAGKKKDEGRGQGKASPPEQNR